MKTLFIKKEELQLLLTGASDDLLIPNTLREALDLPENDEAGYHDEGVCFCEEHSFAPEYDTIPIKSMGSEVVSVIFSNPSSNPCNQLKEEWPNSIATSSEVKRWLEEESVVHYDWCLTQPDMPWKNA